MQQIKNKPRYFQRLSRFNRQVHDLVKQAKEQGMWEYTDCYGCAGKLGEYKIVSCPDGESDNEYQALCPDCYRKSLQFIDYDKL